MSNSNELPIEPCFFDKNGTEIKEFDLLKIFHFEGKNKRTST